MYLEIPASSGTRSFLHSSRGNSNIPHSWHSSRQFETVWLNSGTFALLWTFIGIFKHLQFDLAHTLFFALTFYLLLTENMRVEFLSGPLSLPSSMSHTRCPPATFVLLTNIKKSRRQIVTSCIAALVIPEYSTGSTTHTLNHGSMRNQRLQITNKKESSNFGCVYLKGNTLVEYFWAPS